jgi:hypothetical protein
LPSTWLGDAAYVNVTVDPGTTVVESAVNVRSASSLVNVNVVGGPV